MVRIPTKISAWPEVIFFDCDGVLIDSESITTRVLYTWAVERLNLLPAQAQKFAEFARGLPTQSLWEAFAVQNAAVNLAELDELDRCIDQTVRYEACLMEGVHEVIASLHMPKAIVSNASFDWIVEVAERVGRGLFGKNLFSASQVCRAKPFPDVYLYAVKQMNVLPSYCVAIEDSIAGVMAASLSGIPVIGFIDREDRHHIAKELLKAGAIEVAQGWPSLREKIYKIHHKINAL